MHDRAVVEYGGLVRYRPDRLWMLVHDDGRQPLASPVVGAGTGRHGHQTTGSWLRTPSNEFVARQGSVGHQLA